MHFPCEVHFRSSSSKIATLHCTCSKRSTHSQLLLEHRNFVARTKCTCAAPARTSKFLQCVAREEITFFRPSSSKSVTFLLYKRGTRSSLPRLKLKIEHAALVMLFADSREFIVLHENYSGFLQCRPRIFCVGDRGLWCVS